MLIILLNVVNTTGQYILNRLIVGEAAARFGTDASAVVDEPAVHHGVFRLDHRRGEPGRPVAAAVRDVARDPAGWACEARCSCCR